MDSNIRPAEICRKALVHLSGALDQSVSDRNLDCINNAYWHSWRYIYFHNEQPTPTPWNIFIKLCLYYDTTAFVFFVFYFIADVLFFCMSQINNLTALLIIKAQSQRHPVSTLSWRIRAALPPRQYLWKKAKEAHLHHFFFPEKKIPI